MTGTPQHVLDEIRDSYFQSGQKTDISEIGGIPYFTNSYWTSKQRQSHSLNEISYRACFKAELPEFFISRLTRPGGTVYDPFMGRGTVPIQAALMGRVAYGNDLSPLSVLLTRPRLRPISESAVVELLHTVDWNKGEIQREDLLAFYHPTTLQKLESLKLFLQGIDCATNPTADWIQMVAINRLSGHSPGFFSTRSMPPNQAVSVKAQLKINQKSGTLPTEKDIPNLILKKTKSLLRNGQPPKDATFSLTTDDARDTSSIESESVDLIITSPPFLDTVDYEKDNWLRCWFAGIDALRIPNHRTETAWVNMVADVLKEQVRILKPEGFVAFEVGEVRKGTVMLERFVWRAAHGLGLKRLGVMVNDQKFTKTSNCWGIANGTKGTNTNRIVLLQKES